MAKRVSFSAETPVLADVGEHHVDLEHSLGLYFSSGSPTYAIRFAGYSQKEIDTELRHRLSEVDLTSSLTLLAAIEAAFRIDYLQRCYRKKKDPLSRALRDIYRRKRQYASLEAEILEAWVNNFSGAGSLVSELRGAFKFRHWLAHGRYWEPKLGRRYDFFGIYDLAEQTFGSFAFYDAG